MPLDSQAAFSVLQTIPAYVHFRTLKENGLRHGDRNAMTALINISEARRYLAATSSLSDVKKIRDKAEAVRNYRQISGESLGAQNEAAEIRLLAERRAGQLLASMKLRGGDRKSKLPKETLMLSDMGVSKIQSHRWQILAGVPDEEFSTRMEELKAGDKEVTTKEFMKLAARQPTVNGKPTVEQPQGVVATLDELIDAGHKFGTIYADPPWQYGNQATRASTDNHYSTMTVGDIAAMPVADLAADNAHLHLWTTNGFLFDAKRIIEAWGFEYKSCFVWVKTQMGIGNYWRVSHEFLLLGVRGKATFASKGERSWAEYPRGKHSAKPDEIRLTIERSSPGPRLEMFGRSPVENWIVMGNQVERRLIAK